MAVTLTASEADAEGEIDAVADAGPDTGADADAEVIGLWPHVPSLILRVRPRVRVILRLHVS